MKLFFVIGFLFLLSSCTLHRYFPFICFRKACVDSAIDIKGFKKRIKGKLVVISRRRNKKPEAKPTDYSSAKAFGSNEGNNDSITSIKGKNVDYYRYLLLFRLKKDPTQLDSIVVEHTSEYKTITELDQVRLNYKLDTLPVRDILMVYVKEYYSKKGAEQEQTHVAKGRTSAIRKFLHRSGIPFPHIKVLQDSLSPPRL
jgi:hypothetical protein